VLVAVGRSPNGKKIDARRRALAVSDRGFVQSTSKCAQHARTSLPSATSLASRCWRTRPCMRHMSRRKPRLARTAFRGTPDPSVAYTDPEVAGAGVTRSNAKGKASVRQGRVWAASGRAIGPTGATRISPNCCSMRPITACSAAASRHHAGDLIGEVCLAVEMGCDPVDVARPSTRIPHCANRSA